jgi:citrate lyase synthetase
MVLIPSVLEIYKATLWGKALNRTFIYLKLNEIAMFKHEGVSKLKKKKTKVCFLLNQAIHLKLFRSETRISFGS